MSSSSAGRDQPELRTLPTQQCLGARDALRLQIELGLVVQHELFPLERPPQLGLQGAFLGAPGGLYPNVSPSGFPAGRLLVPLMHQLTYHSPASPRPPRGESGL